MEYTVINLLEIKDSLGDHWIGREKDKYRGVCSGCGEPVLQSQNACVVCNVPVIWFNSKVWKQEYGSPAQAEKRLLSAADDLLGQRLCSLAGVQRFPNPHTKKKWEYTLRHLDQKEIESIVSYCQSSLARRNQHMKGLIQFVLNTAEMRIRMKPQIEEEESTPIHGDPGDRGSQDAPY